MIITVPFSISFSKNDSNNLKYSCVYVMLLGWIVISSQGFVSILLVPLPCFLSIVPCFIKYNAF